MTSMLVRTMKILYQGTYRFLNNIESNSRLRINYRNSGKL